MDTSKIIEIVNEMSDFVDRVDEEKLVEMIDWLREYLEDEEISVSSRNEKEMMSAALGFFVTELSERANQ